MARYSKPVHPIDAAALFDGLPGNYIRRHRDGSAYPGRQGPGVRRISAHVREHNDLAAVQFMHDHKNDPAVRATREFNTFVRLRDSGIPLRNRITPSLPRRAGGDGAGLLIVAGIVGLAALVGWLVKTISKSRKALPPHSV